MQDSAALKAADSDVCVNAIAPGPVGAMRSRFTGTAERTAALAKGHLVMSAGQPRSLVPRSSFPRTRYHSSPGRFLPSRAARPRADLTLDRRGWCPVHRPHRPARSPALRNTDRHSEKTNGALLVFKGIVDRCGTARMRTASIRN
jgi:NAD(P)-dependent dehydrogenase (short-subunit alcohol dehydrogenase family)